MNKYFFKIQKNNFFYAIQFCLIKKINQIIKTCKKIIQILNFMFQYLLILFSIILLVVILWLIQPYKNWKKNFDNRQYQPIVIFSTDGTKSSFQQYRAKNTKKVELSLVVPSYNQQERLPVMLDDTAKYLKQINKKYQIIIVNDGSKDNTTQAALNKAKELSLNLVVVQYPKNRGKGGAVRAGMFVAQGDRVLMVDADGATTFSDLGKVWDKLQEIVKAKGHPMVMTVGSRRHMQEQGKVQRKFHRKFISAVFKFVITVLLGIKTHDTQCGFKLFTRQSAKQLFSTLHIERFAFDVQLFFLCNNFKIQTAQVPVEWRDVDGSKLNVLDASVNMFRDVLMIRFYYLIRLWKTSDKVQVK